MASSTSAKDPPAVLRNPAESIERRLERLDRIALRMSGAAIRSHSTGALSPKLFAEIEHIRPGAKTIEQESELYRLEAIAVWVLDLEQQSEHILSKVAFCIRPDEDDLLSDIPEFLRRPRLQAQ